MRYRVYVKNCTVPAFMVSANGVIIHATHKMQWALGHTFREIHRALKDQGCTWSVVSARTDKPNHSDWIDYSGPPSKMVLGG